MIDLAEFKTEAAKIARSRTQAREDYEKFAKEEASNENAYRKKKAQAFAQARLKKHSVAECEMLADSNSADEREARDVSRIAAKAALLRISELEADRGMLRTEAEWSQRLEGLPQPAWSAGAS